MAPRKQKFFATDTCVLVNDPTKIGIVDRTWNEVDDPGPLSTLITIHRHPNVPHVIYERFLGTGIPPKGYIFVDFSDIHYGNFLVPEESLKLIDRSMGFGDVVKRDANDSMSGVVIQTFTTCSLQPLFTGAPFTRPRLSENVSTQGNDRHNSSEGSNETDEPPALSSHDFAKMLHNVPDNELQLTQNIEIGCYVIYHDWLGHITNIFEEVTIRLNDDSIVTVETNLALSLPDFSRQARPSSTTGRCFPGQFVVTYKRNLLRGQWRSGAYDPSVPPEGYVVDVKTVSVEIKWLQQNFFQSVSKKLDFKQPPTLLALENLAEHELIQYHQNAFPLQASDGKPTLVPYPTGSSFTAGDFVRFIDKESAAVKYNGMTETNASGHRNYFQPISQEETHGYDMNVFRVMQTTSRVKVLWQDCTESEENCIDLVPYLDVGIQDVWPGDIVVTRTEMNNWVSSTNNNPSLVDAPMKPKKIGIIQSSNGKERVATVRWFKNPNVELSGPALMVLVPGSQLGQISDEVEEVPVYELFVPLSLTMRRGDMVFIIPEKFMLVEYTGLGKALKYRPDVPNEETPQQSHSSPSEQQQTSPNPAHTLEDSASSASTDHDNTAAALKTSSENESSGTNPRRWKGVDATVPLQEGVGQIVHIDLEGTVTVRLGAREPCEDLHIPIDRIFLRVEDTISDDEEDGGLFPDENDFTEGEDEDYEDYDEFFDDGDFSGYDEYGEYEESRYPSEHVFEISASGEDLLFPAFDDTSSEEDFGRYHTGPLWVSGQVQETVEYEGGEQVAGNGGEDEWTTDEDADEMEIESSSNQSTSEANAQADVSSEEHGDDEILSQSKSSSDISMTVEKTPRADDAVSLACSHIEPLSAIDDECPPAFAILEGIPTDHYFIDKPMNLVNLRRIQQEHKILSSSCPEGIFIRTWEGRLDLLRCLIVGPMDTPYEMAPFVVDFYLGAEFPIGPPKAFFHSWTNGFGPINPNLYEEGKICLSLLNTFPGDGPNDKWCSSSTMLQVVVSLMGLVLVEKPFYNEAGFDVLNDVEGSQTSSAQYTEKSYISSKLFVLHALRQPPDGLTDIIDWLYRTPLPDSGPRPEYLRRVIAEGEEAVKLSEDSKETNAEMVRNPDTQKTYPRISRGGKMVLRQHIEELKAILEKEQKEEMAETAQEKMAQDIKG